MANAGPHKSLESQQNYIGKIEKCKNRNDHETLAIMMKEERTPYINNQHSKNEFLKFYLK